MFRLALARRIQFQPISTSIMGNFRSMATYVPTEKILLTSFNKELISNEKRRSRDVEINTMNTGRLLMKTHGFEIEDIENSMDVKMIKEIDEETGISVTIDFDCWSHCVKDKSPEAYDVIVRKRNNDNFLVITCVNHPEFLPVGLRIVPNTKDVRDMVVYGGPKFTRLPENVLVC